MNAVARIDDLQTQLSLHRAERFRRRLTIRGLVATSLLAVVAALGSIFNSVQSLDRYQAPLLHLPTVDISASAEGPVSAAKHVATADVDIGWMLPLPSMQIGPREVVISEAAEVKAEAEVFEKLATQATPVVTKTVESISDPAFDVIAQPLVDFVDGTFAKFMGVTLMIMGVGMGFVRGSMTLVILGFAQGAIFMSAGTIVRSLLGVG